MALERTDLLDEAKVPFGKRQVKYPTPNRSNLVVIEGVPVSPEQYEPIPMHSPHPDYANNGLILVWQGPVKAANNQIKVLRVYATQYTNEDWYNYAIKFSADVYTAPIFVRTYIKLREGYVPPASGSVLGGVVRLLVTAPGTYTPGSPPTVAFSGGGTGAAANPIMDETKTMVIGLDLIDEGENYTSNPTIAFSPPGATASAFIQPQNCYLVKEETEKLDQQDPQLHGLFIKVTRIYETLPGPWVTYTRYDNDLGFVSGQKRSVLASGQSEILTAIMRINYEGREGSAIVSIETEETWTDGIASPFPTWVAEEYKDAFHEPAKRGATDHREIIVVATGSEASSLTHSGGNVTKIQYQPYPPNPFLLKKITDVWVSPIVNDQKWTSEFGGGILNVTERTDDVGVQDVDTGLLVVASETITKNPHEQTKRSEILNDSAWPPLVEEKVITEGLYTGVRIQITKQVVDPDTPNPNPDPFASNPPTFTEFLPHDSTKKLMLTSKILSYPETPLVYFSNEEVHLPQKLTTTDYDWAIESHNGGAAHVSLDDSIARSEATGGTEVIPVAKVFADAGYRGAALSRITKSFFLMTTEGVGPADDIVDVPEKIVPSNGVMILTGRKVSGTSIVGNVDNSLDIDGKIIREIREFGPFLTAGVSISASQAVEADGPDGFDNTAVATSPPAPPGKDGTFNAELIATSPDATVEITAPASTPTELVTGTFYIWRVNVLQGPLGLFVIEKIEIKAP